MIKVAIMQRTVTQYRIPVFNKIGESPQIDLTVLFGSESPAGVLSRSIGISSQVFYQKAKALSIRLKYKSKVYFLPIYVTLLITLMVKRYDVVIAEGTTNILNNIGIYVCCRILNRKFIWWY